MDGKIVIITGGASGTGAESARLFTDHGAQVVVVDLQEEQGKTSPFQSAKTEQVFTVVMLQTRRNQPGVLETPGSILDLNLERFHRTMAVNVRGAAVSIKHAARAMVEKGTRGSIVCTTSVTSEIVVRDLMNTRRRSMGSHDEETAKQTEEYCEARGIFKGVVLKARHVAEAALFLASDDSVYISGQNLAVDGGFCVVKPI
ncbi:putative oxidoreductase [Arabidopsis thaliana]|uniref:NAD(P)-binding Rossmann-fold superfamily protein n=3 Tax=Arabidopsis TaxID=3701 RepID=O80711_ARATH|nr:NAD(P)-binding Rossmann-fold superfamily protein [Arabidopsis thaliana]AAC34216.1 putative alcohol dehydrogenase [Arabidopsis thaliana]AEC10807.1 NAD(P)-binding Rossmann-fold superfamily protein [Arabidopsis thaliana]KAG7640016.1 Short-chain dehydrogenase/reductase SDR [Arabidopsis thaliana x Arabidopsis arenosa]KAG7644606.1 Short-chain dehydrogenase/reductase SDR [Arabidopsis suecica]|eukprot:NP_182237.1 NAD(P)-binding Rossmann-fold superfamily protein [Arabidopsis thaliana]